MVGANASSISTQYYKLAHLGSINYTIYTSSDNNDQALLELELTIRHKWPQILVTYYNKSLYYFVFGHNQANSEMIDLSNEFPQLSTKYTDTVNVDQFPNPHKTTKGDDNLAMASLSFLKATKKMILYNLSLCGAIKLFGNYCVTTTGNSVYSILCIDPILFQNGDLIVSCVEKPFTQLFSSSIAYPRNLAIDTNFVIYLIPSGIRCHLFDPTSLRNNLIEKPQIENGKLLELLKITTGVQCDESTLWVKLIPNLKHLNNQTSTIGKFIHSVDNKKFILWPWDLCLLQIGKYEATIHEEGFIESAELNNPLHLISSFLDFRITHNSQLKHQVDNLLDHQQGEAVNVSLSAGSVQATGASSIGNVPDISKDVDTVGLNTTTPIETDLFNLQDTEEFFKSDNIQMDIESQIHKTETENENDMEIDDLFGGDESEDNDDLEEVDGEKEKLTPSNITVERNGENDNALEEEFVSKPTPSKENANLDSKIAPPDSINEDIVPGKEDIKPKEVRPSYIDILKDKMTIEKIDSSPDYKDPGAPLPIIPTPLVSSTISQSAATSNPPSVGSGLGPGGEALHEGNNAYVQSSQISQLPQQKSAFSPILFNPIIKSDIDTKYGKGGKFYVAKDSTSNGNFEGKNRSLRATSVSGMEIPFSSEDKKRLQHELELLDSSTTSENDEGGDNDDDGNDYENDKGDDDYEEEEEEEEEEESDEDEESDIGKSTPLKLNTQNDSLPPQQSNYNPINTNDSGSNTSNNNTDKQGFENTEGFGTPFPNQVSKYSMKPESPFAGNDMQSSVSPMYFDTSQSHQSPQLQPSAGTLEVLKTSSLESPSKISESSNYLPLILRSINVATIPSSYLMNNLISSKLLPSFTISDDALENDLDITKSNEMIVKLGFLKEFLDFMSPNIIFDLGLMTTDESDYYINGADDLSLGSNTGLSSDWILNNLSKVFPCTYPMKLIELLYDFKSLELEDQLDNQLNFLNEIANEEDFGGPKALYRKLKALEWDSFSSNDLNKANFDKYKNVMEKLSTENAVNDDDYFRLPTVKTRILKNGNIVNLNNIGLKFWKYLNFNPVKKSKDFQILLIAETHRNTASYATEFLEQIIQNYKECNFGTISKVNLSTVETRPDLEPISGGLVLVNKGHDQSYNDFYIQTNKKLISLVELIKLDLINKTNNFEFGKPLLLFFIDFNESLNSNVQICKIFRNFKVALTTHQLPLVDIFTKIVPSSLLVKKVYHESALKVFSNYKLTKLSMNLYNECPNDLVNKSIVKNLFTTIVKDPPSKIQFKFMNNSYRDNSSNNDIFLHLAYERSIDNNWFVASWSDPLGQVVHVKSWYCSDTVSKSEKSTYRGDVMDIMSITDDIWNISTELFKILNDESCSIGGKKFLVLTRINSIIPDVELVHWKRLSSKHKEISLIVMSVRQTPRMVGSNESETLEPKSNDSAPTPMIQDKDIFFGFKQTFSTSNTSSPSASGGALVTSPNSLSLHSPQQFLNAPANFLSPQDLIAPSSSGISSAKPGNSSIDPEVVLEIQDNEVYGVIPKVPLPSFNSPTRFCMKTGYLMMQVNQPTEEEYQDDVKKAYLVYEINVLSCSNYWNLDVLMKLIMSQYKQMIALNDILCMNPILGESVISGAHSRNNAIVPWHINAVGKLLDYLVHIYVDKD
ncbi:SCA1 protein [Candida dubliniensis CD36]|uniref:Mediator of RNA polymerase II transcription subunit 13 n=1 Tax=Candida dubliniensis (strain CD36 / ATCC MYA-646 / CBS 7987 / NCPF 3949 / NRRL Y-17841) TaxID=573826 RepID=B9WAJ4_CANDC|nr:SCA1 protein [Candida dubliniensis CD36]CAX43414.1 SCA1 protein [Candida dubliniensis CD36]